MGNGMENRLNFSDEFKKNISENKMTEESAKQFLLSNGIPEEKVNAHLASIQSAIAIRRNENREQTLDALLTLYSYISGKGYVAYDGSFLNQPIQNESVTATTENISQSAIPKNSETVESSQVPETSEKPQENPVQPQEKSEGVVIVEENATYDETLPHERQKAVREYFANRGNETVVVRWKEVKIETLLTGNALKDGKIGAITLALEEKMKAEQNVPQSTETPVAQTETMEPKDESQNSIPTTNEPMITIEESLTKTYD